jgi:hypothetical protein
MSEKKRSRLTSITTLVEFARNPLDREFLESQQRRAEEKRKQELVNQFKDIL